MNRDITISKIRMLAMLMIICLHMDNSGFFGYNAYVDYILDAGVGIFFCISAWLYGKKSVTREIKYFYTKSFMKILGPVWLLQSIIVAINIMVFHKEFDGLKIAVNAMLGLCAYGHVDGCRHLWFITYILFCYLITPLLEWIDISNKKNTGKQFGVKIFLFITVLLILGQYKIIGLSVFYPIEYSVIYFISRRINYYEKNDTMGLQCLIIFLGILFTGIWFAYVWDGFCTLPMSSTIKILQSQFETLTSAAVFLICYNVLNFHRKQKIDGICSLILKFSDKYSYSIYLTHAYLIWNNNLNFMFLSGYKILDFLLTIFEVLLVGVIFQKIYNLIASSIRLRILN